MIQKPDLLTVFSREGIETDRHGKFRCPFHDDKTPSGKVYTSSGRWRCFACDIGGDSIDFVMRRHSLSYPEALRHLGINGPRTPESIRAEREARAARERRERYRESLRCLTNSLSDILRGLYQLAENWKDYDITPASRDEWAERVQEIPHLEYKLDVIINGDEQDKLEIYKERMNGKGKRLQFGRGTKILGHHPERALPL